MNAALSSQRILTVFFFLLCPLCATCRSYSKEPAKSPRGSQDASASVPSELPRSCDGGDNAFNDVSKLNAVAVSRVCRISTKSLAPSASMSIVEDDIRKILSYARKSKKKVTIAGARHSQGGHISSPGGIVLDMTDFNRVTLTPELRKKRLVVAEAGATWAEIQNIADNQGITPATYAKRLADPNNTAPESLSVKVMQSSNIFTVGGSLSVNCHGRDIQYGALISTVRSFRIMQADGTIVTASRDASTAAGKELFRLAIGGFGLFGVILDAEIELTDNVMVEKSVEMLDYNAYADYFMTKIRPDSNVRLHFGRLNIDNLDKKNFLKEMYHVTYRETPRIDNPTPPMSEERYVNIMAKVSEFTERNDFLKRLRWKAQLQFEDRPGSVEHSSLNQAMRPPIQFLLKRNVNTRTNILQEYFVPVSRFAAFTDALRLVARTHNINLQNVTVRYAQKNDSAFLSWAKTDVFAFVLFINIDLNDKAMKKAEAWTQALVEATLKEGGTYFLPYQRWPTRKQLLASYPEFDAFLKKKLDYDPGELFVNQFYATYKLPHSIIHE